MMTKKRKRKRESTQNILDALVTVPDIFHNFLKHLDYSDGLRLRLVAKRFKQSVDAEDLPPIPSVFKCKTVAGHIISFFISPGATFACGYGVGNQLGDIEYYEDMPRVAGSIVNDGRGGCHEPQRIKPNNINSHIISVMTARTISGIYSLFLCENSDKTQSVYGCGDGLINETISVAFNLGSVSPIIQMIDYDQQILFLHENGEIYSYRKSSYFPTYPTRIKELGSTPFKVIQMEAPFKAKERQPLLLLLHENGEIWGKGAKGLSELLDMPLQSEGLIPVALGFESPVVKMALSHEGPAFMILLHKDGTVSGCGSVINNLLVPSDAVLPIIRKVNFYFDGAKVIDIVVTNEEKNPRICFLSNRGHVYSWGFGKNGQLGLCGANRQVTGLPIKIDPAHFGNSPVMSVSMSFSHTLFVCRNRLVYGAGWNYRGAMGLGSTIDNTFVPMLIPMPMHRVNHENYIKNLAYYTRIKELKAKILALEASLNNRQLELGNKVVELLQGQSYPSNIRGLLEGYKLLMKHGLVPLPVSGEYQELLAICEQQETESPSYLDTARRLLAKNYSGLLSLIWAAGNPSAIEPEKEKIPALLFKAYSRVLHVYGADDRLQPHSEETEPSSENRHTPF